MKDILLGDKIRVTREFTVTQVSSTHIGDDIGQYSFERNDFEILEKRPPQVGDVIASRKGLKKLPELSVVIGSGTPPQRPLLVTRKGTIAVSAGTSDPWVTEKFHKADGSSAPYTVVYIPSV